MYILVIQHFQVVSMEYPTCHLYFLGMHMPQNNSGLLFEIWAGTRYATPDVKVELNTIEYTTAFLNSGQQYFLWHGIKFITHVHNYCCAHYPFFFKGFLIAVARRRGLLKVPKTNWNITAKRATSQKQVIKSQVDQQCDIFYDQRYIFASIYFKKLTEQKMGARKHQHQPIHGLIRNPSMLSKLSQKR